MIDCYWIALRHNKVQLLGNLLFHERNYIVKAFFYRMTNKFHPEDILRPALCNVLWKKIDKNCIVYRMNTWEEPLERRKKFILMFKCLLYDFYRHKNSLRVFAYMRGNFLVFVYLKTLHISFFLLLLPTRFLFKHLRYWNHNIGAGRSWWKQIPLKFLLPFCLPCGLLFNFWLSKKKTQHEE